MSIPEQSDRSSSSRAIRLTFRHEADDIHLLRKQYLQMVVPPSDALSEFESEQGFWIEVRTARDDLLYRLAMRDPFYGFREVFSPDPDRSIYRVALDQPSGAFTVLIPDLPDANHIIFVRAAPGIERLAAEVARFDLRSRAGGGES